jgi:WhiB family transcriptional regulator, redox-sensing transcriptional regulator
VAEDWGDETFQQGDWHGDWRRRAACRDGDPDRLFVRGAAQREAKLVCFGCPVRIQCLAEALDHRIEFGVWGGMTERERRALLRRRPDVQSWVELLQHGSSDDVIRAG